jgi:hypothetical protein
MYTMLFVLLIFLMGLSTICLLSLCRVAHSE